MVEKRFRTFVTSNGLVPVDTICDAIGSGASMAKLTRSFPVSVDDVLDCINFYAENTTLPTIGEDKLLDLVNVGSDEEVIIEIIKLHQIVYIKLLAICLKYNPYSVNFSTMVNQALRACCLNIIDKLDNNIAITDPMELLVQDALQRNIPDVLIDREKTKEDLDFDQFVESSKKTL